MIEEHARLSGVSKEGLAMHPTLTGPTRTRAVVVLFAVASLVQGGCVDLKEVQAFAATAAAVGERFPGLAKDLHDSCMAQQRYIVAQRQDFRVDQFADLNDPEHPLLEAGRKTCQLYKDEQERLIKANATLVSYMKSMGDLAADDLTNFDKGIGAFGSALAGAQLFSEAESGAIAKLAGALARMASEGYRRNQLRDVIRETNADVALTTAALGRIVSKNYVLQLENERVAMREYYRKLALESVRFSRLAIAHAQGETDLTNPVPLDDLKSKFEARNTAINTKVGGAQAYAKVLASVAAGHQELFDHVDQLTSRAVLSAALAEAKTIQALASEFLKAF
jgi:hypothetical protein